MYWVSNMIRGERCLFADLSIEMFKESINSQKSMVNKAIRIDAPEWEQNYCNKKAEKIWQKLVKTGVQTKKIMELSNKFLVRH